MKTPWRIANYGKPFLICLLLVAESAWAIFTTVWMSVDLNSMTVAGKRCVVADGLYTVEMRLVNPKALIVWSERNSVQIVANKFSVELGKTKPLSPSLLVKNPGVVWEVWVIGGTGEGVKYDQKLPLSWSGGAFYADEAGHAANADRAKVADALSATATINGTQVVGQVASAKTADSATVANSLAPTATVGGSQVVGQVASARTADTAAVANSLSPTAKVNGTQIVGQVASAKTADVANGLAPGATVDATQIRGGGHGSGLDADLLDGKHLQEVIEMARTSSATSRTAIAVNQPGHVMQQGSLVVWDEAARMWDHPNARASRCMGDPLAYGFDAYQENPGQPQYQRIQSFCTAFSRPWPDEAVGIVEVVDADWFRVVFAGQANALAGDLRGQRNLMPNHPYWLDLPSLTLTDTPIGESPFIIATAVDAGVLLARVSRKPFEVSKSVRCDLPAQGAPAQNCNGQRFEPIVVNQPGRYSISLRGLTLTPSGSEYLDNLHLCGRTLEAHFQSYPACNAANGECRQQLQIEDEVELAAGESVQICAQVRTSNNGTYEMNDLAYLTATLRIREVEGR